MALFDLQKLREIAGEGIARHGLRGYARKLGLDVSTVRSLRDGRDMQISKVMEIVAALDLTLNLKPGEAPDAGTPESALRTASALDTAQPIAFHAEAEETGLSHVSFQPDWLAAHGLDAAHLRCVTAPKESGANCVPPGALCLLDCAPHWPEEHAIWAYLDGGHLHVRYLSRPGPGVLLIADCDPSVPPRQVSGPALDAVAPLGRVVWTGTLLARFR